MLIRIFILSCLSFNCLAEWEYKEKVDSFTDEVTFTLSGRSEDYLGVFYVHCTNTGFVWGNFSTTGLFKELRYRDEITFRVANKKHVRLYGRGKQDIVQISSQTKGISDFFTLLKNIKKGEIMKYRIHTRDGQKLVTTITPTNSQNEIQKFLNRCSI